MGRPRKIESDDRYNEANLNLGENPSAEESQDPDSEEMLAELGTMDRHDRFDRMSDENMFASRWG